MTDSLDTGADARESSDAIRLRAMTADDWPRVAAIYAAGIATGDATFETEPPTWEHFDESHSAEFRLVALDDDDRVIGWVAAGAVSDRSVYGGVVAHSVYVDIAARGRGVGRALLEGLIQLTEAQGIWTIESGIFPENTASLALHEACGFRVIGRRERIGKNFGRWRDVIIVERRSNKVGS
jgi:phosphinothricin acetyltransferase